MEEEPHPMKFIRFEQDYFGYLVDTDIRGEEVDRIRTFFEEAWPGKKLIVVRADEFIDLTGQYEIVPVADVAA